MNVVGFGSSQVQIPALLIADFEFCLEENYCSRTGSVAYTSSCLVGTGDSFRAVTAEEM
jgi:hypothetical protein